MESSDRMERFIREYLERFVPAASGRWNYVDGCLMNAALLLYRERKEICYRDFLVRYYEQYIGGDGSIRTYRLEDYNLDNINSGNGLFFLYEETGEEKYRRAAGLLMEQLKGQPRTVTGNFWHKKRYPEQVWLDGLYMAQVFYARAIAADEPEGGPDKYHDIVSQFENVRNYLYNREKGLHYHAIDMAKRQSWCSKETGLSANFWGRACGWHLMALIDTMEVINARGSEPYEKLGELFREAVRGIFRYQDGETGLFYQVLDKKEVPGNYPETSGSAMIAYAVLKGCRMKVLPCGEYREQAERILHSLMERKLEETDGMLRLGGICRGAGLSDDRDGSVAYYLSEPVVYDDHKGAAPFIMAYLEALRLEGWLLFTP